MSLVMMRVYEILNDSAGISDPRSNRFLMKTPLQPVIISLLYLTFIYKIGPRLMKNREPFDLRKIIIGYNIIQIILNVILFYMFYKTSSHLVWACSPPASPKTTNPTILLGVQAHYYYAILKYIDLIETLMSIHCLAVSKTKPNVFLDILNDVRWNSSNLRSKKAHLLSYLFIFFVLRKKQRQISYLHVHHHIGMIAASWISCKYFPGGQALYVALYNTAVHAVMYCYYLFTSLNPNNGKSVWWKKYITLMQIIQHYMVFFSVIPAVVNVNCSYPKGLMSLFSINVILIIYLFSKFYNDNYLKKKKGD